MMRPHSGWSASQPRSNSSWARQMIGTTAPAVLPSAELVVLQLFNQMADQ